MLTNEWRKSSRSGDAGNCAEVRRNGDRIEVRNSKAPEAGTATFTPDEWRAFLGGAADGEFSID
jgi:hypothetical protein